MATKGFTKIDNSIIVDSDLSPVAFMLYAKIKYYATIEGFKINREHIKTVSGHGETAFRRAWKELKDKGLLIQTKERIKGKFEYTYSLDGIKTTAAPVEENVEEKKHIDSDGNIPIDGQIDFDDVLGAEQEEPAINKNIVEVINITGFNNVQAKELLEIAGDDVNQVINAYRYTISQEDVKNIFAYVKWAIRNNKVIFQSVKRNELQVKSMFNNFKQRQYDFNKLQKALLYGDPYELPI